MHADDIKDFVGFDKKHPVGFTEVYERRKERIIKDIIMEHSVTRKFLADVVAKRDDSVPPAPPGIPEPADTDKRAREGDDPALQPSPKRAAGVSVKSDVDYDDDEEADMEETGMEVDPRSRERSRSSSSER